MIQYVPLLEQYTLDSSLEILLESENGLLEFGEKLKASIKNLSHESIINLMQRWIDKAASMPSKMKLALVGLLVTICLTQIPLDSLNRIKTNDPQTKEILKQHSKHNQNKEFLEALAHSESSGNWKAAKRGSKKGNDGIVRNIDYVGKYQFGYYAFKDIGKNPISYDKFKAKPAAYPEHQQDTDMLSLLKKNKRYLHKHLNTIGKKIGGIDITESGLLAAAHLVGNKNVRNFLNSNGTINPKDGNGVSCTDYIKKFNGYKLKI